MHQEHGSSNTKVLTTPDAEFESPNRLSQDVAEEISNTGLFSERFLVVISKVTRVLMERAIADLAKSGELERLAQ
jgi:hypothetical protein